MPERQNLKYFRFPLFLAAGWLIALLTLLYFSSAFSDHRPLFQELAGKWDAGWYQSIAANGYHVARSQSNIAFLPLYPLLSKLVTVFGVPVWLSGIILSLTCLTLALIILFRWLSKQYGSVIAKTTLPVLLFFPFSFFFGLFYAESLFLLLEVLCLWLVYKKQWWLAALFAGLGSATRLVGVFLTIIVVGSCLKNIGWKWQKSLLKLVGLSAASLSGLMAFMVYQYVRFHDFLAFVHIQKFWPGRGSGIAGLWTEAHNIRHGHVFSNPFALNLVELGCLALFIGLSIYCLLRIDAFWGIFCLAALGVALVSGSTISINRYVIVLVPCFIALAQILKQKYVYWLIPSSMLLAFFFNLYYSTQIFLG